MSGPRKDVATAGAEFMKVLRRGVKAPGSQNRAIRVTLLEYVGALNVMLKDAGTPDSLTVMTQQPRGSLSEAEGK